MDMTGEVRIPASREVVWRALNDPDILKQCIAGCEEIAKLSDTEFTAKVTAKVGPVKARFAGRVTLSELDPPNGYRISGEGQGGAAGFAKGSAQVRLAPEGEATRLSYSVNAAIGGKLAQIGARLVDGTARKMAGDFFGTFAGIVGAGAPTAGPPPAEPPPAEAPAEAPEPLPAVEPVAALAAPPGPAAEPAPGEEPPTRSRGLPPWLWAGGLIVIAILLLLHYGLGRK